MQLTSLRYGPAKAKMRGQLFVLLLVFVITPVTQPAWSEEIPVQSKVILSDVYTIDRKYPSMRGPYGVQEVQLGEAGSPSELLWVTGYRAVMVGPDGEEAASPEFMCHSNLDIDMERHRDLFPWKKQASTRLFTLSQGQFDIAFPAGFGLPIFSDEVFSLNTQVLNHNIEGQTFQVRHKIEIDYVRAADLKTPLRPLFMAAATGLVSLEGQGEQGEDAYFNVRNPDAEDHGPGCLIGLGATQHTYKDAFGRKFSGHWTVKPGREVNRTLATTWMQLPFDTTVHYIGVHLHPFAESLELRDLTTGKTVFKSKVRGTPEHIGIEHVEYFSSPEGISVYTGHEYELVSTYNNTTDVDQDSMAVMFLYLLDKELQKTNLARLTQSRN